MRQKQKLPPKSSKLVWKGYVKENGVERLLVVSPDDKEVIQVLGAYPMTEGESIIMRQEMHEARWLPEKKDG